MGSPSNQLDRALDEGPEVEVTLTKGYWMGKYPTTQREYHSLIGTNPSRFKGDDNRPVEEISWSEALTYCAELTSLGRARAKLPAGYAYRLPTEAEWEYACRAGTTTRFSYGEDPCYKRLGRYAWYDSNSDSTTHPVGQKLPNAWGLFDMHGNVWEWCLDWYGPYLGGSVVDPRGSEAGSYRVIRGGGWGVDASLCATASRGNNSYPWFRSNYRGFRVVLALQQ